MKFGNRACELARTTEIAVVDLHKNLTEIRDRTSELLSLINFRLRLIELPDDDKGYIEDCIVDRLGYALDEIDDALVDLHVGIIECKEIKND